MSDPRQTSLFANLGGPAASRDVPDAPTPAARATPADSPAETAPERRVDEGLAPTDAPPAFAPLEGPVPASADVPPRVPPPAFSLTNEPPPPRRRTPPVAPAPLAPEVGALAAALPSRLRLGTSSWGFAGWEGLVWGGRYTDDRLSREGLGAYASHPLLRSVGLDRTHYRPMPAHALAELAAQVPADFRFLVKAHEDCTLARFPGHARYGARRDQSNALFLDPGYALDKVVGPTLEGLGSRAGVILFQFAPQPLAQLGGVRGFVDRLHAFLSALPRGNTHLAVEVRTPSLLVPAYAEALLDIGAVPALSAWNGLPPIDEQFRRTRAAEAPARVIRWMLQEGNSYEEAKDRYAPFDRMVDPDPVTREAIAALCVDLTKDTYVIANNKAEGSAPRSLLALAERIAARRGPTS